MNDEMVEAVARAIHDNILPRPDAHSLNYAARAAITAIAPMIREECAKVADDKADWYRAEYFRIAEKGKNPPPVLQISYTAATEIATAIRSMGDAK
jgi:hypothetical protein